VAWRMGRGSGVTYVRCCNQGWTLDGFLPIMLSQLTCTGCQHCPLVTYAALRHELLWPWPLYATGCSSLLQRLEHECIDHAWKVLGVVMRRHISTKLRVDSQITAGDFNCMHDQADPVLFH